MIDGEFILMALGLLVLGSGIYALFSDQARYMSALEAVYGLNPPLPEYHHK